MIHSHEVPGQADPRKSSHASRGLGTPGVILGARKVCWGDKNTPDCSGECA